MPESIITNDRRIAMSYNIVELIFFFSNRVLPLYLFICLIIIGMIEAMPIDATQQRGFWSHETARLGFGLVG